MLRLAVTLGDKRTEARICDAFIDCRTFAVPPHELITHAQHDPVHALLFDAETVACLGLPFLADFKTRFQSTALVYCTSRWPVDPSRRSEQMAFDIGRVGADAICFANRDDSAKAMRRALQEGLSNTVARVVALQVANVSPALAAAHWQKIFLRIPELKTAGDLGTLLGLSLRELRSLLRSQHMPSPRRLLVWCRLLLAAKLLEDRSKTTEAVGLWLNYSSGPAFRNSCRGLLDAGPQQIRCAGGLAFVLPKFAQAGDRE